MTEDHEIGLKAVRFKKHDMNLKKTFFFKVSKVLGYTSVIFFSFSPQLGLIDAVYSNETH